MYKLLNIIHRAVEIAVVATAVFAVFLVNTYLGILLATLICVEYVTRVITARYATQTFLNALQEMEDDMELVKRRGQGGFDQ